MTDKSEEGAAKEGVDEDKRVDILLAVKPLSHRDFGGCLQPVHLLGLASWCQPRLQGCLVPPRSLGQTRLCSHSMLGLRLCEKLGVMVFPSPPSCQEQPRGDSHWTQAIFREPGQVSQTDVMRTCSCIYFSILKGVFLLNRCVLTGRCQGSLNAEKEN